MKRRQEGEHLSKEQHDSQLFNPGGSDGTEQPLGANAAVMATRKIAPLKKKKFGTSKPSSPLPNVFAGIAATPFGAGANGANGAGVNSGTPAPTGGFGFGSAAPAPASPGFGASNGGFSFSAPQQPEQPKPNPFGAFGQASSAAPQSTGFSFNSAPSPATNGSGFFGGSAPASPVTAPTPAPAFSGFGQNNGTPPPEPAPLFNKTPDFSFGGPPNGGMFGNNASAENKPSGTGFVFGQPPAAENKPAFSGFGQTPASPAPAATFGNAHPAPVSGTTSATSSFAGSFGSPAPEKQDETPKAAPFTFGSGFGNQAPASAPEKKEEPPKPFGFSGFGNQASNSAPENSDEPAKPAPFAGFGSGFGASPALEKKEEPAKPAPFAGFGNGFGSSTSKADEPAKPAAFAGFGNSSTAGNTLFGKPADNTASAPQSNIFGGATNNGTTSSSSIFDKPADSTASKSTLFGSMDNSSTIGSGSSLFGKPAEKPAFSFGAPAEKKDEAPTLGFGTPGEKKDEAPKFAFGTPAKKDETPKFGSATPTEKKDEAPKFSFGAPPKKDEQSKSPFGTPVTEKKQEPSKPLFGNAAPAPTGSLFSSPKSGSVFGQPAENKSPPAKSPQPTASNAIASFPGFSAQPVSSPSTNGIRARSPPLPPDASQWSAAQLTEYYNLFALRSLNHAFKEQLTKVDMLADWSELCKVYLAEVTHIKDLMSRSQRYKFDDTKKSAKRAGEDMTEGGGKRNKTVAEEKPSAAQFFASAIGEREPSSTKEPLASKPMFEFRPPSSSAPVSSGPALAAAPAFGFKPPTAAPSDGDGKTSAASPSGSVFDNPSPSSSSTWANPFAKADTKDMSDDEESDHDDDSDAKKIDSSSSSDPKPSGSLFDRISEPPKPTSNLFGDPAKNPFGSNAKNPFSAASSGGSSLFGNSTSTAPASDTNGTGFSFAPSPAPSSAPASAPASDAEINDSSDATPPPQVESDLAAKGPGEEDEDSFFQQRAIVYDSTEGAYKKVGAGTLRVLKNRVDGKSRLLIRTDTGNVLLNVRLQQKMLSSYKMRDSRHLFVPEVTPEGTIKKWTLRVAKDDDGKKMFEAVKTVLA